jgi:sugar transferase (PEP-CTERM system associated)
MLKTYRLRQFMLALGDIVLLIISIQFALFLRFGSHFDVLSFQPTGSAITIIIYVVFIYIFDLYNLARNGSRNALFVKVGTASLSAGILSTFLFFAFPFWKYGRGIWFIQVLVAVLFLFGWRWIFHLTLPKKLHLENVFILGAGNAGRFFSQWMSQLSIQYRIKGFIDDDELKIGESIGRYKVIGKSSEIIAIGEREDTRTLIVAINKAKSKACIKNILHAKLCGWTIKDMVGIYEQTMMRIPVNHIQDEWLLLADGFFLIEKSYLQKSKRLYDVLAAITLFFILLPSILLTMIFIKLDSRGPIFYKQDRVGKNSKIFKLFKFRSMIQNAESTVAIWAKENDERTTRIGKWIRLFRIDEIPQLYNVFKGDMSLVGPRPERPEFVQKLEKQIPNYFIRNTVKPGLTGWAQVNYRYGASVEDALIKLEYDLYYIKNMSLIFDCQILLKTIGTVLFGQGAR